MPDPATFRAAELERYRLLVIVTPYAVNPRADRVGLPSLPGHEQA
jgi:hypothetical protein